MLFKLIKFMTRIIVNFGALKFKIGIRIPVFSGAFESSKDGYQNLDGKSVGKREKLIY